jgi:tetratricopeptide (TPR) repeat protein
MDEAEDSFELFTPREQVAALLNRGLAHLSLLHLEQARTDLDRALELSVVEGIREQEFKARHNLGCLEFYAGRFPEAIRLMREADEMDASVQRARARHDLALVLLEVGLLDQARTALRSALAEARADRLRLDEGDIHLDLARCALLLQQPGSAKAELGAAVAAYRSRGATQRRRSAALQRAAADVEDARVPKNLDQVLAPWLHDDHPVTPEDRLAVRVRAEAALLRGDLTTAEQALLRLRTKAPQGVAAAMHDRLLRARVAAARGEAASARRTVRDALTRLTTTLQPSQSVEVRSALAVHGRRLAAFDLADAMRSGSPRRAFDSVERWRAVSHRLAPVSAELDPRRVELLAELRLIRHVLAGSDFPEGMERNRLREKAVRLEWKVAQADWATADGVDKGAPGRSAVRAAKLSQVQPLLASEGVTAVVLFDHDGEHYALHVRGNRTTLHPLGPSSHIASLAAQLNRDLRARAFAAPDPALATAIQRAVDSSVRLLDTALFASVPAEPGMGLVVIPGRTLTSVPWNLLPSLAGRPVTVSPSMSRWAGGHSPTTGRPPTTVTALAGPGLTHASREVEDVGSVWRNSHPLTCLNGATSVDVKDALASSALVHIAAHGNHEEQSPFFSSLRMGDGPVFAHELPRPLAAQHVVLSACEVGRSDLRPGDEPLGLTAALLALGATSVVAAVAPVRDEVASRAMVRYQEHLASGQSASAALAAAVAEHPAAGAFCLFGTDWSPTP